MTEPKEGEKEYYTYRWKMYHKPNVARCFREVMSKDPKRVLDVGCGNGHMTKRFVEAGIDAWGTDISPNAGGLIPDRFVCADARKLPFKNNEFDVVLAKDMFEHIPEEDIDMVYAEMCRVAPIVIAEICLKMKPWPGHITLKPREWWEQKLRNCIILKLPYERPGGIIKN